MAALGMQRTVNHNGCATALYSAGVSNVASRELKSHTAIGYNENGTRLLLVLTDGRKHGSRAGMTLPQTIDLFLARDAMRAADVDVKNFELAMARGNVRLTPVERRPRWIEADVSARRREVTDQPQRNAPLPQPTSRMVWSGCRPQSDRSVAAVPPT